MKSYGSMVFGFGVLGGIGMGIGYAARTPAALKWFGPQNAAWWLVWSWVGTAAQPCCIEPLAAV